MLLLKKSKQRHFSEMDFHEEDDDIIRSSHSQMLVEIGVLKKFVIFTGKRLCWTPRQLFSCVYIERILITPFTEHLWWLLFYYFIAFNSVSYTPVIFQLDLLFWKKYYFDFFAEVFFYLLFL